MAQRLIVKLTTALMLLLIISTLVAPVLADTVYTVQSGDTLYRIANKFGVTVAAIQKANNLSSTLIYPGQQLTIPGAAGSTNGTGSSGGVPASSSSGTYTVQRGDTLYRIATKYGITVAALQSANHLTSAIIYAGQVLIIPGQTSNNGQAVVNSFTANKLNVALGETATLSWNASGAKIMLCPDPQLGIPCQEVQPTGSYTVNFDHALKASNNMLFQLMVYAAANSTTGPTISTVTITVNCTNKWFFTNPPDECAGLAANKWAVMEQFEHGRMAWFQDYGETYVLTDTNAELKPLTEVRDTTGKTYPDSDASIVPPQGFYQPVRGFGKFWRGAVPGYTWVRQQLGWATEPEQAYSSFYQCNTALGEARRCYVSTPKGEIIAFAFSSSPSWRAVTGSVMSNLQPAKLPGKFLCSTIGGKEFVVFNADMSGTFKRVTDFSSYNGFSFSPDGKKVVFGANQGVSDDTELFAANADGTGPVTQLTDNKFSDFMPSWSPDGKRIAFVSQRDNQSGLFLMNADGSNQAFIANTKAEDSHPSWSPDSKSLVFFSAQADPAKNAIFRINVDGTGRTQLTNGNDLNPSWSPDGKRIVFESHRDDTGTGGSSYEIYVMNADGKNVVRLTNNKAVDYLPVWSPDNQWVAYSSLDNGGLVYALRADGSGQTWRLIENSTCNEKAWGI